MPIEVAPGRPEKCTMVSAVRDHRECTMASAAQEHKHPLLEADRIGRRIPGTEKWLLRDVNLRLHPGARLGIVGPSGSGKSLLLRSLALLDPLDEGSIRFRGVPAGEKGTADYRRQVMYLHQRPTLFEGDVEANLRQPFALKIHAKSQFDERLVLELLRKVGRQHSFLQKSATGLSGGERQLVALIRSIQVKPSVLLLDEPTASLDAEATRAVEQLLEQWMTEGEHALVEVTHDRAQVERVAKQILRLDKPSDMRGEVK